MWHVGFRFPLQIVKVDLVELTCATTWDRLAAWWQDFRPASKGRAKGVGAPTSCMQFESLAVYPAGPMEMPAIV